MKPFTKPVSVKALSSMINLSGQAIRAAIARGEIPAARLSAEGRFRIPPDFANQLVAQFHGKTPK